MKQLIITIMLLASVQAFALDDCVGTSIKETTVIKENKGNRIMATDLALWYNYYVGDVTLTPYTNIKTWFIQNGYVFYKSQPFRDVYSIGGKAEWNNFGIDFDHYCSHSVCSGQEQWDNYNREKVIDPITGKTIYKIAGSQVTKVTLSYLFEFRDLTAYFAAGKTLETTSYLLNTRLSYDLHISAFTFKTYAEAAYWTEDKRSIITAGERISYKSVSFDVQYYKSNKLLGRYNNNHTYEENPITESEVMLSLMYRFN